MYNSNLDIYDTASEQVTKWNEILHRRVLDISNIWDNIQTYTYLHNKCIVFAEHLYCNYFASCPPPPLENLHCV